jgi:hypothetical protein
LPLDDFEFNLIAFLKALVAKPYKSSQSSSFCGRGGKSVKEILQLQTRGFDKLDTFRVLGIAQSDKRHFPERRTHNAR